MTNRALVLAALADGPGLVRGPLRSRDTLLMAAALSALGVGVNESVEEDRHGAWEIAPGALTGDCEVDCGLAGTVMRFVPPVAALADGPVRFTGDRRAAARPMRALLDALRALGVDVDGGALPFTVRGTGTVRGGEVVVDASASSQFVSGLLLSGAAYENGVLVRHRGGRLPSLPHVAMTVAMLRDTGVEVADGESDAWRVAPGRPQAGELVVEPDLSSAAPFLAAALVTGGSVTVPGWPDRTTQAGDALRDILAELGATVRRGEDGLTVSGQGAVRGVDLDLGEVGELTPVLAAVCAVADAPSVLRGVAHLRGHETDRLAALATELARLGAGVTETADGLRIEPRPLHGDIVHTYDDHRIAQAACVLGLVVDGVRVANVATTGKTMPGFPALWTELVDGGTGGSEL